MKIVSEVYRNWNISAMIIVYLKDMCETYRQYNKYPTPRVFLIHYGSSGLKIVAEADIWKYINQIGKFLYELWVLEPQWRVAMGRFYLGDDIVKLAKLQE